MFSAHKLTRIASLHSQYGRVRFLTLCALCVSAVQYLNNPGEVLVSLVPLVVPSPYFLAYWRLGVLAVSYLSPYPISATIGTTACRSA